jgi:hypothetical protein
MPSPRPYFTLPAHSPFTGTHRAALRLVVCTGAGSAVAAAVPCLQLMIM